MSKPKPNTIANVAVIPRLAPTPIRIIGCRHLGIVPILPICERPAAGSGWR